VARLHGGPQIGFEAVLQRAHGDENSAAEGGTPREDQETTLGSMRPRTVLRLAGAAATVGGATLAYATLVERNLFTLRRFDVPVLPPDAEPLRILHLSDLHLTPGQHRKQHWVAELAATDPDLVVVTGDNIAHVDAVPAAVRALGPLLDRPGAFVFGSNDYRG